MYHQLVNLKRWNTKGKLPKTPSLNALGTIDLGHVDHQVDNAVGVAPLVVVPGDELDEPGVEHDASLGVEDGGDGAADEVLRHEVLISVSKEALHVTVSTALDLLADILVGGLLGQLGGEVDDGHVGGGHTEGHAGKLALEGRNHGSDGLGSARGGGDDVGRGTTATAPVLL